MSRRIDKAVAEMKRQLRAGREWPDASADVAARFNVTPEALAEAIDDLDAILLRNAKEA